MMLTAQPPRVAVADATPHLLCFALHMDGSSDVGLTNRDGSIAYEAARLPAGLNEMH